MSSLPGCRESNSTLTCVCNAIEGGSVLQAASTHSAAIAVRADPLLTDPHGEQE
jgi:hypothetical protein